MTGKVVVFPSFAGDAVRPYELRQLVSALEARFNGLEQDTFLSIGGEEFTLDDLDDRYAPNSHTHTESEITDFGTYLEDLTGSSIFELSDVTNGTPVNNDILVWNAGTGEFDLVPFTLSGSTLNSLSDVHVPNPNDGDLLSYNDANNRWEASAVAGGAFVTIATDQNITGDKTFLADVFMELDTDEGLGRSYSLWFGQGSIRRVELYNDSAATTGGFWFDFQPQHLEPSVRIGVDGDTAFQFQADAGQHVFGGRYLRLYDLTDSDYVEFSHDGTDAIITGVSTGAFSFAGATVRTPASISTRAGLRVPHGTSPDSPVDGDVWSNATAFYGRAGGETVPFSFDGPGKQVLTTIWSLHEWSDGTTRSWPEP